MAEREIYKGIEFIRISSLPRDQRDRIKLSFPKEKIIKILRDEEILKDCVQYHEYQVWFKETYQNQPNAVQNQPENTFSNSMNLSLK